MCKRIDRSLDVPFRFSSYSLQYSGGQATEGQGGFYGSGGARAAFKPSTTQDEALEQDGDDKGATLFLALAADVQRVSLTMKEVQTLESLLSSSSSSSSTEEETVDSKSIEVRQSIKKLMTAPEFSESLLRLEVQGQPVWGLSSAEREMIVLAREKVNEC